MSESDPVDGLTMENMCRVHLSEVTSNVLFILTGGYLCNTTTSMLDVHGATFFTLWSIMV